MVVAIAIGWMTAAGARAAGEHQYVGASKCRTCHKKELIGNQYGEWQKGDHAKAYDTLKSDKALKLAKEKGVTGPPNEAKECLKCHMTAFGKPATAFARAPLKASDGVQCESCHGPGSDYKKKTTMSDQDKAIAAGLWKPGDDEKICTACHNDESPTWDPAKGFDYAAAKKEIAHPIPEDVKGKYIELEKKQRAERRARGEAEEEEEDE
jgi:hypothetical protein